MNSAPWSDAENDILVADYFEMLQAEVARRSYSKAAHNRGVQARIARGKGSIEFKHQNVSAVLKGLGEIWIDGYKPAVNVQASLISAVLRWMEAHPDWLDRPLPARPGGMAESPPIWVGPPPTKRNAPPPPETEQMLAIARLCDVAARDERNRTLGRAGEEIALAHERSVLRGADRPDLAERVRWVSQLDGDGAGYDIASFEPDGGERLVEVKTTRGWERTPFHISRNELAVAEARRDAWCLLRLYDVARAPKAFELRPPLEAHVALTATSFRASFEGG
jgi:hypothetical protein